MISEKWRTIVLLAFSGFLGMSLWFSASAVTPALIIEWRLSTGEAAWLTMAVQIGFVVGALLSALFNAADIWHPRLVFTAGTFLGALANGLIPAFVSSLLPALALRFVTGFALALVYPVAMKMMTTWMKEDRGFGLGLFVGALAVGSALPHLIRAFGQIHEWRWVMYTVSGLAVFGGVLVWRFTTLGPYQTPSPPFHWRYIGDSLRVRSLRLANFGYLGHMWELYAMWTWIPIFLLESYRSSNDSTGFIFQNPEMMAAIIAFATIGAGGLFGSLLAGYMADRWGRTRTTILSMFISGMCALFIGFFFSGNSLPVTLIALIWGFAIVSDSAQFSACVSELSDYQYVGTALTIQTCMGFLLTMASIRLIPVLVNWIGWQWAFSTLAVGPILGIQAMWLLKRSPESAKLAGGRG